MNGRAFAWRLWGGVILVGAVVVAAALAAPLRLPETAARAERADVLPEGAAEPAPEDLAAFLEIRRWGALPPAPEPEPAEPARPALNPELARMGFVGLIDTPDSRAVLLALPEGDIVRMVPGDTVPDGRILVSVTDNDLTLEGEEGVAEVLTLFPPLPPGGVSSDAGSGEVVPPAVPAEASPAPGAGAAAPDGQGAAPLPPAASISAFR